MDEHNSYSDITPEIIRLAKMSEEAGYDKTNKALKLERYDWNPGYTDGYVSQAVDVVGGQKYTLKVLAKGGINASVKYGYIRLEEVQDRAKGITQEITSDDMKEYTLEYNPTSACKQLRRRDGADTVRVARARLHQRAFAAHAALREPA